MRFGTSFFNGTLYQKTVMRFWPVWALYFIFWLMVLPMRFLSEAMRRSQWDSNADLTAYLQQQAQDIPSMLQGLLVLSAIMGILCAMAVFSYLYSHRSACMIHALPMRRETIFGSQYLAGLSFFMVPHIIIYVLMLATEVSMNCLNLWSLTLWFLVQSGTCFFFYSFGVFCAMFTGHLLALPVFYGILNGLVLVVLALIQEVCRIYLYGFAGFGTIVEEGAVWLTPFIKLYTAINTSYVQPLDQVRLFDAKVVIVYAVVGVLLTVAALLLYRGRHIESAGDVVSVKIVRPIFKYGFALCVGLSGGMVTKAILYLENNVAFMLWMVIWGIVGYFVAEMLLQKSFRVLKAWKGSVAVVIAIVLFSVSIYQDWYGFEQWTPNPEQVERVQLKGLRGSPWDSANSEIDRDDVEGIAQMVALHQAIIHQDTTGKGNQDTGWATITYIMKDGHTIRRSYDGISMYEGDLTTEGTVAYAAQAILDDRENVAQLYNIEEVNLNRLVECYIDSIWNEETQKMETLYLDGGTQKLWDAVQQDFAEGTLGVRYLFDGSEERQNNTYYSDLTFIYESKSTNAYDESDVSYQMHWSITLTPQATHTLTALRELGVLKEPYVLLTNAEYYMLDF